MAGSWCRCSGGRAGFWPAGAQRKLRGKEGDREVDWLREEAPGPPTVLPLWNMTESTAKAQGDKTEEACPSRLRRARRQAQQHRSDSILSENHGDVRMSGGRSDWGTSPSWVGRGLRSLLQIGIWPRHSPRAEHVLSVQEQ